MRYLGIDPGVSGGLALLDYQGDYMSAWKMPDDAAKVARLVGDIARSGPVSVLLEHVRSSPQMGVVSSFTFGRGVGILEGVLAHAGLQVSTITPRQWMARMGCLTGGDKNISKARAEEFFPGVNITHWNADALLIARYHFHVSEAVVRSRNN